MTTDFIQRLLDERGELAMRVEKLKKFTAGETFAALDYNRQRLLKVQLTLMQAYLRVLHDRIELEQQ